MFNVSTRFLVAKIQPSLLDLQKSQVEIARLTLIKEANFQSIFFVISVQVQTKVLWKSCQWWFWCQQRWRWRRTWGWDFRRPTFKSGNGSHQRRPFYPLHCRPDQRPRNQREGLPNSTAGHWPRRWYGKLKINCKKKLKVFWRMYFHQIL